MAYKHQVTLLLFLLLISGSLSSLHAQSLTQDKVDEFTGDRIIQSESEKIDHEGFSGRTYISAFYNEGTYVMIITVISNDSWQLLSTNTAYFLIDGERESHDLKRVETDVSSGTTTERHAIILSESEFERFGEAEEIRFKAGGNVYTLSQEAIKSFSLVLDTLEE